MSTRREIDIETGEVRLISTTAYMVGDAIVLIDDGESVPPGAVLASTLPMPEVVDEPPQLTADQAARMMTFLKANPDILAAAQL